MILARLIGVLALFASQDLDHPALFETADDLAIERVEKDGELVCSVRATRVPALRLARALAAEFQLEIDGIHLLPTTEVVSLDLQRRPLRQVWEFLAGTLGLGAQLRGKTVSFLAEQDAPDNVSEMLDEASRRYIGLQRDFPEHPLVAEALFQRGWVEERRNALTAAWTSYDMLTEHFPESTRVPQALFRGGVVLSRAKSWEKAAEKLSTLLRLEGVAELEAPARTALARCLAHLDRSEAALAMLDALEAFLPAQTGPDVQERQYVRARALNGVRRWKEAVVALDAADARDRTPDQELESLELRAVALEGLANWAGASRNWLLLSNKAAGTERTICLRHAARLALAAGDEVAVLFIASMATESERDPEILASDKQARERLALYERKQFTETPSARLAHAERLLDAGSELEAHALLASLHPLRSSLKPPELLQFTLHYARALGERDGIERAIELLREALPITNDAAKRREIYLLASDIYERAGQFDAAIAALEGRL